MARKTPVTEHYSAPQPMPYIHHEHEMPRQKQIERQGDLTEPVVRVFPRVIGGVCEYCGILDPNQPSEYQYKLCPHYRGMQLRCSYCPSSKDPDDIIYHAKLLVYEHPNDANKMIVVCNSYDCTKKHQARFRL